MFIIIIILLKSTKQLALNNEAKNK